MKVIEFEVIYYIQDDVLKGDNREIYIKIYHEIVDGSIS